MIDFFKEFLALYAIPFFALALLPRWWLFVPVSVLAAALVCWLHSELAKVDGPEMIVAPIIVGLIELGLLAGFLARSYILLSRRMRWWLPHSGLVLVASFITIPLLCYGYSKFVGFV